MFPIIPFIIPVIHEIGMLISMLQWPSIESML